MPETVPAGVQGVENDRAYPFARLHAEPASTSPNRFALRIRDPHVDAHVAIRLGLIDSMTIIGVGSRTVRASRVLVRDALHASRSEELDAAVAAHLLGVEARVQASADARELAAQVRPLAINVNDLDHRARAGEAVALSSEVPELIELLREVRALLGDRTAA